MTAEEFRRHGYRAIDWIADYLEHSDRYPVLPPMNPGDLIDALPACGPEQGEPMDAILADFEKLIVPATTQWNHPGFMAYFGISGSPPGHAGRGASAALNGNGMMWKSCPRWSNWKQVTLRWLLAMERLARKIGSADFRYGIDEQHARHRGRARRADPESRDASGCDRRAHGLYVGAGALVD